MGDGPKPFLLREAGSAGDALPRYSRPVLIRLRAIRHVADEALALPREARREIADALCLMAAYIDLQMQIDGVDD